MDMRDGSPRIVALAKIPDDVRGLLRQIGIGFATVQAARRCHGDDHLAGIGQIRLHRSFSLALF